MEAMETLGGKTYDVFLSYNRSDEKVVESLAGRLRKAGFAVFFDQTHLAGGAEWQGELEKGLAASCVCVVLLGEKGLGRWQKQEMRTALTQAQAGEGFRVVPVLLPGGPRPGEEPLTGFLANQQAADLRGGAESEEAFQTLLLGVLGLPPGSGEEKTVPTPRVGAELGRIEKKLQTLEEAREMELLESKDADQKKAQLEAERQALLARPQIRVRGPSGGPGAPPPDDAHGEALAAYFRALARECAQLPLPIIDKEFTTRAGEAPVPLPRVYIDLDLVTPVEEREGAEGKEGRWGLLLARGEGKDRTALLEAAAQPAHRQAVLVGDAGSGKTTFAHYLAWLLATGDAVVPEGLAGLLPVRLVLRDVAARHIPADAKKGSASMLWAALEEDLMRRLGESEVKGVFAALRTRLLKGGGFFLLDGLDEVPEAHRRRRALLEAVAELASEAGEPSRVWVTARPYAYADPKWKLDGFATLALAPFSGEQVERFVGRFYEAVREGLHWSPEEAGARARALTGAVGDRAYLADLASRPLLLTLMATLHSSWGRLPDDRADLYEEIVQLLLARWQRARMVTSPSGEEVSDPGISRTLGVGEEKVRARLEELAFRVHERQRTEDERREESADISEAELLVVMKPLLEAVGPETLLRYLKERAGLLIERREGVYAFPHRTFQEYLAAAWLASRPDAAVALRRRVAEDPAWWREVFLLAVGKARQGRLPDAVGLVQSIVTWECGEDGDLHWRLAALAGEALVDLRLLERAGEAIADYEQMIVGDVRRRLVALIGGGHLPPRERLGAGDSLGRLGDPRPGVGVVVVGERRVPDIEWVEIPGGEFRMGSEEGEEGAFGWEQPAHTLDLPGFYLARYLVTNAQFGAFMEDGGYECEELWTADGWAWRQGAEADLSVVDDDEWRKRFKEWLAWRPLGKRNRPCWWGDPRWSSPSRPVVGINWYEALAFCCWLDGQIRGTEWWQAREEVLEGYGVRLPSEAEWEKAARGGKGWRWPWGDEFGEGRANTEEAGVGQTSVVGMFPTGRNPYGLDDMAGNVWEWTLSRWGRRSIFMPDYGYPYGPRDGREALGGPDLRMFCGGPWVSNLWLVRCASHNRNIPMGFGNGVGFRCGVFPGCFLDSES